MLTVMLCGGCWVVFDCSSFCVVLLVSGWVVLVLWTTTGAGDAVEDVDDPVILNLIILLLLGFGESYFGPNPATMMISSL